MATDYVPKSYPNLDDWLDTLKTEIASRAARLGLAPADLTAFTARLDAIGVPVKDWIAADRAVADAASRVSDALRDHLPRCAPKSSPAMCALPAGNPASMP
jgi:hypothetical protein